MKNKLSINNSKKKLKSRSGRKRSRRKRSRSRSNNRSKKIKIQKGKGWGKIRINITDVSEDTDVGFLQIKEHLLMKIEEYTEKIKIFTKKRKRYKGEFNIPKYKEYEKKLEFANTKKKKFNEKLIEVENKKINYKLKQLIFFGEDNDEFNAATHSHGLFSVINENDVTSPIIMDNTKLNDYIERAGENPIIKTKIANNFDFFDKMGTVGFKFMRFNRHYLKSSKPNDNLLSNGLRLHIYNRQEEIMKKVTKIYYKEFTEKQILINEEYTSKHYRHIIFGCAEMMQYFMNFGKNMNRYSFIGLAIDPWTEEKNFIYLLYIIYICGGFLFVIPEYGNSCFGQSDCFIPSINSDIVIDNQTGGSLSLLIENLKKSSELEKEKFTRVTLREFNTLKMLKKLGYINFEEIEDPGSSSEDQDDDIFKYDSKMFKLNLNSKVLQNISNPSNNKAAVAARKSPGPQQGSVQKLNPYFKIPDIGDAHSVPHTPSAPQPPSGQKGRAGQGRKPRRASAFSGNQTIQSNTLLDAADIINKGINFKIYKVNIISGKKAAIKNFLLQFMEESCFTQEHQSGENESGKYETILIDHEFASDQLSVIESRPQGARIRKPATIGAQAQIAESGRITKAEADAQRERNNEKGFGYITDKEANIQRAENNAEGLGDITHEEADAQRESNNDGGFGYITNEEADTQREKNNEEGFEEITDEQKYNFQYKEIDNFLREREK